MARLSPTLEQVEGLRIRPTDGEKYLLKFLSENLDDSFEVYFQPYLNGDNPDVIILREGSGALIIEVKDWDLNNYELNDRRNWVLKHVSNFNGQRQVVKSPIQQVFEYKENLYNLHIDTLLEKRIKNPKFLSIVSCCVYFHNATTAKVESLLTDGFEAKENYIKFLSHFNLIGRDSLTPIGFKQILAKRWLDRTSYLFDQDLYRSFKRYLQPPNHTIEQGIGITYTDEQQKIIISKGGSQQKTKGVAGSGKTLALAKRAVNAHLRHKGNVLILTFNISLRNYIRDKINEVRENFEWKYFTILHFHHFIRAHNNNINHVEDLNDTTTPEGLFFQTIIVDEIQDYEKDWVTSIKSFLAPQGEFVVFGDEKQNIYKRELEDRKPYTGISGAWNILKKSFRVSTSIANLATLFQRTFFTGKYDHDEILVQRSLFDASEIRYFSALSLQDILMIYQNTLTELHIHDNDVSIQSSKVGVIRSIDQLIRTTLHKKTNTMFETQEVYEMLASRFSDNDEKLKHELENIRRYKKFNFWMNSGTTKLSTIHSFKGWEIPTLFLIIEKESDQEHEFTSDELIYTAITRCRQNLIIINLGHERYHSFFKASV